MVVHTCKSALGRLRQEEYMHLRPAWVVEQDPTKKKKKQELEIYFRGGTCKALGLILSTVKIRFKKE